MIPFLLTFHTRGLLLLHQIWAKRIQQQEMLDEIVDLTHPP